MRARLINRYTTRREILRYANHWCCFLACISLGCATQRPSPIATDTHGVETCALIEDIGHFIPRKDSSGTIAFPFFVDLKILSRPVGSSASELAIGQSLRRRIHSPSRTFLASESEAKGKTYYIRLFKNSEGWVMGYANRQVSKCPAT